MRTFFGKCHTLVVVSNSQEKNQKSAGICLNQFQRDGKLAKAYFTETQGRESKD